MDLGKLHDANSTDNLGLTTRNTASQKSWHLTCQTI